MNLKNYTSNVPTHHLWDGKQSYYQAIKGSNFKQLGMGEKAAA